MHGEHLQNLRVAAVDDAATTEIGKGLAGETRRCVTGGDDDEQAVEFHGAKIDCWRTGYEVRVMETTAVSGARTAKLRSVSSIIAWRVSASV